MATLLLQCVVAVLTTLFGVAALRVVPRVRSASELHRAAWMLTGIVFTMLGISTVIQNCVAAPWAYFSGQGTSAYDLFIRFSPVGNHSRGVLIVAYSAMMAGLVTMTRVVHGRFVGFVLLASFAAMLTGAALGWLEGPLVQSRHWTATAISDSVELILLMTALLVAVVWNTTDRLLWVALVVFTVHELLDVVWYSALAWTEVRGAWHPHPMYIHLYASVAYGLMIAMAVRRANLARRGVKVPGLLEPPAQTAPSMLM